MLNLQFSGDELGKSVYHYALQHQEFHTTQSRDAGHETCDCVY